MTAQKKIKKLKRLKGIREKVRDEARIRLEEVEEKKRTLQEKSRDLGFRWEGAVGTFKNKCGEGNITTEELWWIRENIDSLEADIKEVDRLMEEVSSDAENIREDLRKKHSEVKLTGIFLDNTSRELRRQVLKEEQKELDELTIISFSK